MTTQQEIVKPDKLTLKNIPALWPNFAGAKKMYNEEGDRNFHIVIEDPSLAEAMISSGWPVKSLKKRDPSDPEAWHLQIKVNLKPTNPYPPRIYKVSLDENGNPEKILELNRDTVMLLDILPIKWLDLTIGPYIWTYQGKSGISAYLEVLYAVTEENPLDVLWEERMGGTILDAEPGLDDVDPAF